MFILTYVSLLTVITIVTCGKCQNLCLNEILFNGDYEFIDLSYPFDNQTVYWPDMRNFEFTRKIEEDVDGSWYAAYDFAAGEHGGTHLDAPFHFFKEGIHPGEIPLEKLIVPLVVIDVSSKVNDNANFVLYKHHLDNLLSDKMGNPCVVVFKFGWGKFYYTDMYLNMDKTTKELNFPGLSGEIAEWVISNKNIVGVGVDVASIDPGSSTNLSAHKILSKEGLYILENVDLNRNILEYGCTALVLPMKIAYGTGAPLRLVAICPKHT